MFWLGCEASQLTYILLLILSFPLIIMSQYDDPKDATLEAVMELLLELDQAEDVRPVLESKFGLKDALRDVVRSSSNSWR